MANLIVSNYLSFTSGLPRAFYASISHVNTPWLKAFLDQTPIYDAFIVPQQWFPYLNLQLRYRMVFSSLPKLSSLIELCTECLKTSGALVKGVRKPHGIQTAQ